jgi:protein-tyrosine phosphatase
VVDLRSEAECVADPPASPGFRHHRLSLFAHYDDDPAYRADLLACVSGLNVAERYKTLYTEALDLDKRRFAEAVQLLAHERQGALFHCAGGKDRTGVLAAPLLRLVEVPMDAVKADYIRTEERARQVGLAITHRYSAPADAITTAIEDLESQYGTAANYLCTAGASEADVAADANKFLCSD